MSAPAPKTVWTGDELASMAFRYEHPLGENTEVHMVSLARLTGLMRTGVNLVTVAPGKSAFPAHAHMNEEEWTFVVAGEATVRLGEETHVLGPGGFVAFWPGGPAHQVTNAGTEPLVCLMGGQTAQTEVVDFPDDNVRLCRSRTGVQQVPLDALAPFDFFAKTRPPGM